MDVEQIQKINKLALDLMRQGLATSRDEAVTQAEKVFRRQEISEYDSFKETWQEVGKEQQPKESKEERSDVSLNPDEIKEILKQNADFMVKKIKEFQEKVMSLEKEMAELRTKVTYHRLPTVEEVKQQSQIQKEEKVSVEGNPRTPTEAASKSSHPRSGNFKAEDVSIEKFFYMGSK